MSARSTPVILAVMQRIEPPIFAPFAKIASTPDTEKVIRIPPLSIAKGVGETLGLTPYDSEDVTDDVGVYVDVAVFVA